LTPSALAKNFIQVQSHGVFGNQSLNLAFEVVGENSHESFGSKAILGTLLVVSYKEIIFL